MNIKEKKFNFLILGLCLFGVMAFSQNYDYHKEEAPAISWNGTQMFDARMLAAGGVSFMASAPFAAVVNPALIPAAGKFSVGFSLGHMGYEAFQYWGVNQGVDFSPSALPADYINLNALALSLPLKKIRFSAGWYVPKLLALPSFDFDYTYWAYTGEFSGRENHFFTAAAVSLGKKFAVGIKGEYISGSRDLATYEYLKYYRNDGYPADSYLLIRRKENHTMKCFVPSLGVTYELSPAWTLGAALVYPINGTAERTVDQVFDNLNNPPISINASSEDTFYRPVRVHFGTVYTSSSSAVSHENKITIAAETIYVGWSEYRYIYFSEETPRDLRNCLLLALGLEFGIYKSEIAYFLRAGYRFDPQPVREPEFTLHTFTLGTGLRHGKFTSDIGFAYYYAPNDMLNQTHFVINGTIIIKI